MNDIERNELEAEQAGREDRYREMMSEVDVINAAERDREEQLWQAWLDSLTVEELAALKARLAQERLNAAEAFARAQQAGNDDLPF